jgi:hypothetical protein
MRQDPHWEGHGVQSHQGLSERTGRDVREYFMLINGPQLLNMWLGETERFIREIFAAARERAKEGLLGLHLH